MNTVKKLNAAIALQSGVTQRINDGVALTRLLSKFDLTRKDRQQIKEFQKSYRSLRRLPRISEGRASQLLGRYSDSFAKAPGIDDLIDPATPDQQGLEALEQQLVAEQQAAAGSQEPATTTTAPPSSSSPSR